MTPPRPRELVRTPTIVDLFRASATIWNAHRIHYDAEYARTEGHAGAVVHGHLHGAYFGQAALAWARGEGELVRLSWRVTRPAFAGETLTVRAQVATVDEAARLVRLALEETNRNGTVCASGEAELRMRGEPRDWREG